MKEKDDNKKSAMDDFASLSQELVNAVGIDYLQKLNACFEEGKSNTVKQHHIIDNWKFEEHQNYLDSIRDVLIKAHKIKHSDEYKKTYNYFRTLKHRGILLEIPKEDNDYSFIFSDFVVSNMADDYLTAAKYEPYELDILKECAPDYLDELLETVSRQCDILHQQNIETRKTLQIANETLEKSNAEKVALEKENVKLKTALSDLKEDNFKLESKLKKTVRNSAWKKKN